MLIVFTMVSCFLPVFAHGNASSDSEVWFVEGWNDVYRKVLLDWISYLSGVTPKVKSISSLSTNIADYSNVQLIVIPYFEGGLSSAQISILKQFVNNGGNLFVGSRPDIITNAWFNTLSLGSYSPQGFMFPHNNALDLSDIFQGNQVPTGIFPNHHGLGYFSQNGLPSTIIPVILDVTGRALVYAGTMGEGKVVFLPDEWQYNFAIHYPCINSPIMLRLISYLISSPIKLLREMNQYVAVRFDDIFPHIPGIVAVDNVFIARNITEITYGVIPSYTATAELLNELGRMTNSEIAMHGDSSGHTDCYDYSYTTAYQRFSAGKQAIISNYGVVPKWYLSPDNYFSNPDVDRALYDLEMNWSSNAKDYFNYFLNLRPSGIYDLSTIGEFRFNLISYWQVIILFEYCRLLGNIPYPLLIHGTENPTYLTELIAYLQSRNANFVTFSELLAKSQRVLDSSGAYISEGFNPNLQDYTWNTSEYYANVSFIPSITGRLYIRFNNTIQSASVNGQYWSQFSNDTLTTPLIPAGSQFMASVSFGSPPPPPPSGPTVYSTTHPDQDTWYRNSDAVLNWTLHIENSSIAGYSYDLDGSATTMPDAIIDTTYTNVSFNNLGDGTSWFHTRAVTNNSVWTETTHFRLRIDTQPPNTVINHITGTNIAQIVGQDTRSGISSIAVKEDNGVWQIYTGTPTVTITFSDGLSHVIEAYSTDNAGNLQPNTTSLTVYNLTVNTDPLNIDSPTGGGWYDANSTAYVQVGNAARFKFQYWYIDGQTQSVYSTQRSSVPVFMDAAHTITAKFEKTNEIYMDDFESGDFSGWTRTEQGANTICTVQAATKYNGSYAALFQRSSSSSGTYDQAWKTLSEAHNELYVRFYFSSDTFSGNNGDDVTVFKIKDQGDTDRVRLRLMKVAGGMRLDFLFYQDGSWRQQNNLIVLGLNGWYSIEIHYKTDSSTGVAEIWVNGNSKYSAVNINTGLYALNQVWIGFDYAYPAPMTLYYDSFVVADAYIGT